MEVRLLPTLLGQQLFPSDYPWNQDITNAPVAANSAAVIAHIGSAVAIHPDWGDDSASNGASPLYGIPYNVVHGNTTAKINATIDNYPGESDIVAAPIPANAVIEGDFQNGPNPNVSSRGDSHLIVWDEDNNIAYEFYQASRPSENADGKWHAAQESVWHMGTDGFRPLGWTSADAAGLSILAGLARPDEGLPTSQGGQGTVPRSDRHHGRWLGWNHQCERRFGVVATQASSGSALIDDQPDAAAANKSPRLAGSTPGRGGDDDRAGEHCQRPEPPGPWGSDATNALSGFRGSTYRCWRFPGSGRPVAAGLR